MTRLAPRPRHALMLGALMLTGLALRIRDVDQLDLWYDEMALWLYSLTGIPTTPLEPPLMSWILFAAMWVTESVSPFILHIVPIVIGVLTIPVVYRCGTALSRDENTGWTAALLLTISPMAIYYSREGRPYAVFILLTTALYAAFLKAYADGARRSWLWFAALLLLCGFTHLLTFQIVLILGLFLAISIIRTRRLVRISRAGLVALGLAVVIGGMWGVSRFTSSEGDGTAMLRAFDGLYPFGPVSFFRTVLVNLGPGPVQAIFGRFSSSDALAIVFLGLFGLGLRRLAVAGPPQTVLFAFLLFAVPLGISYLTLGEKGAWDWARYISHLLVPFILVCSIGWQSAISVVRSAQLRAVALMLFVAALLPHTLTLSYRDEYTTYREMASFLNSHQQDLKGVFVLSYLHTMGAADDRITNIYLQLKQEPLPVFQLSDGVIRQVDLVPSRGAIARLGVPGAVPAHPLPSGRYAFLWRQPVKDCHLVEQWMKAGTLKASRPTTDATLPPVMTICELDFPI